MTKPGVVTSFGQIPVVTLFVALWTHQHRFIQIAHFITVKQENKIITLPVYYLYLYLLPYTTREHCPETVNKHKYTNNRGCNKHVRIKSQPCKVESNLNTEVLFDVIERLMPIKFIFLK